MGKLFTDAEGNTSSKRVFGVVLLSIGTVLKILLFVRCLYGCSLADGQLANDVTDTFFLTGGTLLGVGVVEYFGGKRRNDSLCDGKTSAQRTLEKM